MPTKISMRIPATTAYMLMPKTMPMTIDSTRNIVPALDMLPTFLLSVCTHHYYTASEFRFYGRNPYRCMQAL